MVKLGREMVRVLVVEYGPDAFVRRIADPVWFQSPGTVLSFDWNASGLTTILTAALKEAIRNEETAWSGTATSSHHSWVPCGDIDVLRRASRERWPDGAGAFYALGMPGFGTGLIVPSHAAMSRGDS